MGSSKLRRSIARSPHSGEVRTLSALPYSARADRLHSHKLPLSQSGDFDLTYAHHHMLYIGLQSIEN